jgi:hypothetical protein
MAKDEDGKRVFYGVGDNDYGELGNDTDEMVVKPVRIKWEI